MTEDFAYWLLCRSDIETFALLVIPALIFATLRALAIKEER